MTDNRKPPESPPEVEPAEDEDAQRPNEELKRETENPGESVDEVQEDEKGLPPGSKTSWN
ncbi:hypothetical protein B5C34_02300 [Pacificimonas flava]|uniref:Uncharacterized protein n=2 Tax=Pacificimonas TaxID=1960290 RepID=A0A219B3J3_9SPHN|nr:MULTISPECIES: hypothetical protein [Pacificimonas]MBZ6377948.1 hypothetical protein [Pacificimonas aurantium]OWV32399.1 hypothetical protein B5C34_02300 [Pacificimonas flava]